MGKPFQITCASVIIYQDNKVLLQKRRDNGCWGYHGGRVELAEVVENAARRELTEETGLHAEELTFFGVFSGPQLHHIYPDGNEVYIIDVVYTCNHFHGSLRMQEEEVTALEWFDLHSLPENLSPPARPALHAFAHKQVSQLTFPEEI